MKVRCDIEEILLEGDYLDAGGAPVLVPSVRLTCTRCDHQTEANGISDRSIRRCLALMREECDENETNFYDCDELEEE